MKINKKEKSAKAQPRSEFRRLKKNNEDPRNHPKYVFEKKGANLRFLSLTHNPPKGADYKPLTKNPNPKDPKRAYISTKAETKKHTEFRQKKMLGWGFSAQDKKTVKQIIKANSRK